MEDSTAPDAVLGTLPGVDFEDPALQASLQRSLRDMQVKDSKDQNKIDSTVRCVSRLATPATAGVTRWLTTATAVLCLRGVALRCVVLCCDAA